jgi:hypothetical protein
MAELVAASQHGGCLARKVSRKGAREKEGAKKDLAALPQ